MAPPMDTREVRVFNEIMEPRLLSARVRRSLAVCSFRRRVRDTHLRQVDNK